jgi:hypothetical protein
MDQESGHGHHAITRAAVHELYVSHQAGGSPRADTHGLINGMNEDQYFHALDRAQEYQDRWYGPTTHSAWADGGAQRQHGMADPHLSGAQNLTIDRNYVEQNLADARHGNDMTHLGAAVHALEDSYSEAHAWRGATANHGDPTAPIESFNVFDPLPNPHMHTWGIFGTEGTHDGRFDHVPVDEKTGELIRGTDKAAAHAVAEALGTFHDHQRSNDADARTAVHAKVGEFFKPNDSGVKVNDVFTDSWAHERDHRLEYHHNEIIEYQPHIGPAHDAGSRHVHGPDHGTPSKTGPIFNSDHIHAVPGHGPGAAYDPGHGPAYDPGHGAAHDTGHSAADQSTAYDPGHSAAYDPGHSMAYDSGHSMAYDPGHSAPAYDPGHSGAGHGVTHDPGYSAAYDNAHAHASGNEAAHAADIAGHAGGHEIV